MEQRKNSYKSMTRVEEERRRLGLTREKLIEVVKNECDVERGMSYPYLCQIEEGRPLTDSAAQILADAFSLVSDDVIRAEYLLGKDDYRTEREYFLNLRWQEENEKYHGVTEKAFNILVDSILQTMPLTTRRKIPQRRAFYEEALDFVVSDTMGNTVLLKADGYLEELRRELEDYAAFKLKRHINDALARQITDNLNKKQDGE